jgi:Protein kinase domain
MNVNVCPDHDTLEAYLLGKLDDGVIDAHLEACDDCQAALDELDTAFNRPFACLRQPAGTVGDWQQPAFQHLVSRAKALGSRASADALTNRTLGNYQLLELVGSGNMGRVYKAQHLLLKKTVAVKLVAPWLVRTPEGRRRFQREMEAVGRLASPHIVTAFDAGEVDGHDFLAMEFVEGDTFSRLVQ